MPTLGRELESILRWLRRTHPLPIPVRVYLTYRVPTDCNGMIEGDELPWHRNKWLRIRLRAGIPQIELRETLLHEWAHGLTALHQDHANSQMDHDSIFTHAYTSLVEEFQVAFSYLPLRRDRLW